MAILNSGVPNGELKDKWTQYKDSINLVNPANKRNIDVIVVGTGLAEFSICTFSRTRLQCNFCYQDSPRRAHSIAAQGGITRLKIIKMMVILFIDYFTTLLKAEIIDLEKLMFID